MGSALYIAPTVLNQSYGTEADLWSLGVTLYVLLSGVPPFWGCTNEEIFESILEDPVKLEIPRLDHVSWEAKELIFLLLNKDPRRGFLSAKDVLSKF